MEKFDFIVYKEDNVFMIECSNYKYIHTFAEKYEEIHKMAIDISELMTDNQTRLFKRNRKIKQNNIIETFSVIVNKKTNKGRVLVSEKV